MAATTSFVYPTDTFVNGSACDGCALPPAQRAREVPPGVICKIWRNDKHDASFNTLQKIAQALEVPVSELIEDGDAPPEARQ